MTRRLINFLSVLSLLFSMAMAALWIRSGFACDEVVVERRHRFVIASFGGHLEFSGWVKRLGLVALSQGRSPTGSWDDVEVSRGAERPYADRWRVRLGSAKAPLAVQATSKAIGQRTYSVQTGPTVNVDTVRGTTTAGPAVLEDVTAYLLPHWVLVLCGGVLPTIWAFRFARRRRAAKVGLCPACGYDLRASPGRCPECGASARVVPPWVAKANI